MTNKENTDKDSPTEGNKRDKAAKILADNVIKLGEKVLAEYDAKHGHDFEAIYKTLHAKFPNIINMDKPVLLAVGIRREMLKHLEDEKDITNLILSKWIKWYFRKSKYYSMHKVGTVRYNLDGTNAGTVTEKDQAKRDKQMQQIKEYQSGQRSNDKKTASTKQDKQVDKDKSKDSAISHDSSDAK
jgi:sRNA-binding protein